MRAASDEVASEPGASMSPGAARSGLAAYQHHVCSADVDAFNVVHFSNYFRWLSAAMMEGLRVSGLGPGRFSNGTVEIRVGRVQAAYVGSARLGDHVEAVVRRWTLERCSLVVHCVVQCAGRVLVRGRLTVAFIESATGALTETPDEVRAALVGLTP